MRSYPKVHEMYQKKKVDTCKSPNYDCLLQSSPLGAYTTIPTLLPKLEAVLEVFLSHLQNLLQFGLDLLYGIKSSPFQLDFYLGEKEVTQG